MFQVTNERISYAEVLSLPTFIGEGTSGIHIFSFTDDVNVDVHKLCATDVSCFTKVLSNVISDNGIDGVGSVHADF